MGTRAHSGIQYSWDDQKARLVWRDHGLRLADLCEVFDGRYAIVEEDGDVYPGGEVRYRALGLFRGTVVVIAYSLPADDEIRLITAWKANKLERIRYYSETFGDQT